MEGKTKFFRLVSESGGVEVRARNHRVFRFPGGLQFVIGKTPSDWRSWNQAFSGLRRALGQTPTKARVGPRRAKRLKSDRSKTNALPPQKEADFAELMRQEGVQEAKWRRS